MSKYAPADATREVTDVKNQEFLSSIELKEKETLIKKMKNKKSKNK